MKIAERAYKNQLNAVKEDNRKAEEDAKKRVQSDRKRTDRSEARNKGEDEQKGYMNATKLTNIRVET